MSKSNSFENDFLKLIFNAVPIDNIADDASSSPLTDLYVALHTADPTESGDQESNEAAYDDYARVAVERSGSGWIVSGNSVSPAAVIEFPEAGATTTPEIITHFSIGVASSGASKILYSGTVTPNISVNVGVTPRLKTDTAITED